MKTKYDIQAETYIQETGITIKKEYMGHCLYFPDDKAQRAKYQITISRKERKSFTFTFGQSLVNSYIFKDYGKIIPFPHNLKGLNEALSKGQETHIQNFRMFLSKIGPSDYAILSCIASDSYNPEGFEDFCGNFGYDTDSIKALYSYLACQKQYNLINCFFTSEEIEKLQRIQ